jgi:tetratricopeptide (TPR) repeat protein
MKTLLSYILVFAAGLGIGLWIKNRPPATVAIEAAEESDSPVAEDTPKESIDSTSTAKSEAKVSTTPEASSAASTPELDSLKNQFAQLFSEQRYNEANLILDQMAKLAPRSAQFLENKSLLLMQTQQFDQAKLVAKECVKNFPRSKACIVDWGNSELQVGTQEEQQTAVDSCVAQFPNDPQCQNMLGSVRLNQGNFADAVSIYQRLLQENGNYGTHFNEGMLNWQLAVALEGSGQSDQAELYFQAACAQQWAAACDHVNMGQ